MAAWAELQAGVKPQQQLNLRLHEVKRRINTLHSLPMSWKAYYLLQLYTTFLSVTDLSLET